MAVFRSPRPLFGHRIVFNLLGDKGLSWSDPRLRSIRPGTLVFVALLATVCGCSREGEDPVSDEETVHALIEEYYFLLKNRKFGKIPALWTKGSATRTRPAQFEAKMKKILVKLGNVESCEAADIAWSSGSAEGCYQTTYDVKYAYGKTKELFTVVKKMGKWRISSINMHSIRFLE
jgi:hypothetical protein